MSIAVSYYLLLDANAWVSERLLQSSIGGAVLYALAGGNSLIALPQVVEMETNHVLEDLAERAVANLRRDANLLKQLSGQRMTLTAPSQEAIRAGVADRWAKLGGVLHRLPFKHEHALAALRRIIGKSAPCGDNNEQFRDCCLWEAALELSASATVHFITNDTAFYEGRSRGNGLAHVLREEAKGKANMLAIYPTLRDFLEATGKGIAVPNEDLIGAAIVKALTPSAVEIAAGKNGGDFELGSPSKPRISGYATPKPSVVAVSFGIRFPLTRIEIVNGEERQLDANLHITGVCSYDPNSGDVSDIEIRQWSKNLDTRDGHSFSGTAWTDPRALEWDFNPARVRYIS